MKVRVINEVADAKTIEQMLIAMFKQEYAQFKVVTTGSVNKQYILYKELDVPNIRKVGDIDIDINEKETETSLIDLLNFLDNTIKLFNEQNGTKYVLRRTEDVIARHKVIKNEAVLHVRASIKNPENNYLEILHLDIELRLHKDVITIKNLNGIEIKGEPLENYIVRKLLILTDVNGNIGRISKDIIDLNDILRDTPIAISADKLVMLMKSLNFPRNKFNQYKKKEILKLIKRLYNNDVGKNDKFEVAIKRVLNFIEPLMTFQGDKYDKWENGEWILK